MSTACSTATSQRGCTIKEIQDGLCKLNTHHPANFRKELARLLSYVPAEALASYWNECKSSVLTHDRQERRFIHDRQAEKKQTSAAILERERLQALGDRLGWGYDVINDCIRQCEANECIITLFADGHGCKRQEVASHDKVLYLILTKGSTLCYHLITKEIFCIDPWKAEMLDHTSPHTCFFIDASGVKRNYKLVYSVKHCPELYELLQSKVKK